MLDRIVEAYSAGKLVARVIVSLDAAGPLTREYDFIKAAKDMISDVSLDQVDEWVVRDPEADAPQRSEDPA